MDLQSNAVAKFKEGQNLTKFLGMGIPAGGILISLLIAVLIIWPKVNEIIELRKDNEELSQRVQTLETKVKVLQSLNQDKLEEQLASAEQLLPSDSNIFAVLRQVEDTASATGVLLNKIETTVGSANTGIPANLPAGNTVSLGAAPAVAVNLAMVADYQSLLNFLSGLYSFSRVVSIDQISVSGGRGDTIALSTSFSVNAHWKELPQNLGSVEASITPLTAAEEEMLANVQSTQIIETPLVPSVPTGRGNPFEPF